MLANQCRIVIAARTQGADNLRRVRNVRRHAKQQFESLEKDGGISRDELERVEKDLQKATDRVIAEVDEMLAHKEQELLEV